MIARLLRILLAAALAVPAIRVVPYGATVTLECSAASASAPHHVALVVAHGNGGVVRVCVGFSGSTIGAEDVLRTSGLEFGVNSSGGYGDEVCQIDNEPSSYDPECLKQGQPYWSLWVSRAGGGWTLSPLGVSSLTLADGDAEGWHYGTGGTAPPSPRGTCPVAPPAALPPPTRTLPPAAHTATTAATPASQAVPSVATVAPQTNGAAPASPAPTGPPVAFLPSAAASPSPEAGVPLRSGPAVARPSSDGPSAAGWTLYSVLLTAGLAVLAAQVWRRRRST